MLRAITEMKLDKAIKHYETITAEYEVGDEERDNHAQLLEWLKELKYYRNEFEKLKNGKPTIEWLY